MDRKTFSSEHLEGMSYLLNSTGAMLAFSQQTQVAEIIAEAATHALGDVAWQNVLRNAPTFKKLLKGDLGSDSAEVLQPDIVTLSRRRKH